MALNFFTFTCVSGYIAYMNCGGIGFWLLLCVFGLFFFLFPISHITPPTLSSLCPPEIVSEVVSGLGFRAFAEHQLFYRWDAPFIVEKFQLNLANGIVFIVKCRHCVDVELEYYEGFIVSFPHSFIE